MSNVEYRMSKYRTQQDTPAAEARLVPSSEPLRHSIFEIRNSIFNYSPPPPHALSHHPNYFDIRYSKFDIRYSITPHPRRTPCPIIRITSTFDIRNSTFDIQLLPSPSSESLQYSIPPITQTPTRPNVECPISNIECRSTEHSRTPPPLKHALSHHPNHFDIRYSKFDIRYSITPLAPTMPPPPHRSRRRHCPMTPAQRLSSARRGPSSAGRSRPPAAT